MRKLSILFLILLFFVVSAFLFWLQLEKKWTKHPNSKMSELIVEIPKGSGIQKISRILQKKHLISDLSAFQWYMRIHKLDRKLKSGVYKLSTTQSIEEIAKILTQGKIATVKLTIPEGRASWEIFRILHEIYPNLDRTKFENLVTNAEFAKKLGVPANNLEGFLFPDTYHLPLKMSEKAILTLFVKHGLKLMKSLGNDSPQLKKLGLLGVVTMASIVEEESGNPAERRHIAGVFLNRLRLGISLGADPTVRFIFRNLTGPIYQSQLDSDSPYNTRKFRGLPPGPISNPGLDAIRAVLHPLKTKDLYFVAKEDGSHTHYFAASLKQHNAYREKVANSR